MSTITHYINDFIYRPFLQIGNFLSRKEIKKLPWLLAFFVLLAAAALSVWPARGKHWTFDAGLEVIAVDASGTNAEPWTYFTTAVPATPPVSLQQVSEVYGKLPLSFEVNKGQTDSSVKFLSRGPGYGLFLTPTEAVLTLRKPKDAEVQHLQRNLIEVKHRRLASADQAPTVPEAPPITVHLKLVGTNPNPTIAGINELPGKVNYLHGNDPRHWRTNISTYGKVKYTQVYPGIDLVYYGNPQQLEHDFVVAAGANPSVIAMEITGPCQASINAKGDLVLASQEGEIRFQKPVMYQLVDGAHRDIAGGYVLTAGQHVGFQVGAYNATKPLVIDPVLVYSTYLGGSSNDWGNDIAVDPAGHAYVTGMTRSLDFPGISGSSLRSSFNGGSEAFVTKLDATGSALIYSTYLGGSNFNEEGRGIAVDPAGNAYIIGDTNSTDFPGTASSLIQSNLAGGFDAFVTKLNAVGSALVYSTYLGGSNNDNGYGIAVDPAGNAYVTGTTSSPDFIGASSSPIQSSWNVGYTDAFVAKINATSSALVYSTYLGGSSVDIGDGIAVDPAGHAYVTGTTSSPDFIGASSSPIQSSLSGEYDAFVTKLNTTGRALVYSTYLGGSRGDDVGGIAVDPAGNAYITGRTVSTDFPGTASSLIQSNLAGGFDAFVTKLNVAGSALVYSTYLGGSGFDIGSDIAVDPAGHAYVTGRTDSSNFPLTSPPIKPSLGGVGGILVTKLNTTGSALVYSTYLGGSSVDFGYGIAVDPAGHVYLTGYTGSTDFPGTVNSPIQSSYGGEYDAFVTKLSIWP